MNVEVGWCVLRNRRKFKAPTISNINCDVMLVGEATKGLIDGLWELYGGYSVS